MSQHDWSADSNKARDQLSFSPRNIFRNEDELNYFHFPLLGKIYYE